MTLERRQIMKDSLQKLIAIWEKCLFAYSVSDIVQFLRENGLRSSVNVFMRKIREKDTIYDLNYENVMLKDIRTEESAQTYADHENNGVETGSQVDKMHILYVVHQFYPYSYAGTEKFVLNISSRIQQYGHTVKILTYGWHRMDGAIEQDKMFVRSYAYRRLPVVEIKHRVLPIDIHTACDNSRVYRFIERFLDAEASYDVIHVGHPMRLTSVMRAALERGIPYVITLTDYWMICPKGTLQTSAGRLCAGPEGGEACRKWCPELSHVSIRRRLGQARHFLRGAHAVVAPSRFLAAVFGREYPDLEVKIIPHGIDGKLFTSKTKETPSRPDRIVFAYCGNIHPHKGVHVLLKAFRQLEAQHVRLRLYGSYTRKKYFAYLSKLADHDPRITFCGRYEYERIGEIFGRIDVLVVPSLWYENYPLVLHEALASRVPVLASNIGGMQEKIRDGLNGLTFRMGDETDLAAKMALLADNLALLDEMKANLAIAKLPSLEEEAATYEQLYQGIREA